MNHHFSNPGTWKSILKAARQRGKTVGAVVGAFDLLHGGHIQLLEAAREACDLVVVGVLSDETVTQAKGAGRPLMEQDERVELVGHIESVDVAVAIDGGSEREFIEAVAPNCLFLPSNAPHFATPSQIDVVRVPTAGPGSQGLIEAICSL